MYAIILFFSLCSVSTAALRQELLINNDTKECYIYQPGKYPVPDGWEMKTYKSYPTYPDSYISECEKLGYTFKQGVIYKTFPEKDYPYKTERILSILFLVGIIGTIFLKRKKI